MQDVAILVVDDDDQIRGQAVRELTEALGPGHRILEANGGERALRLVREANPEIMLLDLSMLPVSGHDVLRTLGTESRLPYLQVIVFSNYATFMDLLRTMRAGVRDFIDKTRWEEELVQRVRIRVADVLARREALQLREELYNLAKITGHDIAQGGRTIMIGALLGELQHRVSDDREAVVLAERLRAHLDAIVEYGRDLGYYARALNIGQLAFDSRVHDLRAIIRHQLSLVPAEAQGIEIKMTLPEPLRVLGDDHMLNRLFNNLFENARKSLGSVETTRKTLSVEGTAASRGLVQVVVGDTGKGFSPDLLRDPFSVGGLAKSQWGDNQPKGTGLGLSYCHKVVTNHGGRILIHSTPGAGAQITLEFPACPDATAEVQV